MTGCVLLNYVLIVIMVLQKVDVKEETVVGISWNKIVMNVSIRIFF